MTLALVLTALAVTALACIAEYHAGRCDNLEYDRDRLRDTVCELYAALDDATRNADYWQARTDMLLQESSTLAIDLEHTEIRNSYLESCFSYRKATIAGYRLLHGQLAPKHLQLTDVRNLP